MRVRSLSLSVLAVGLALLLSIPAGAFHVRKAWDPIYDFAREYQEMGYTYTELSCRGTDPTDRYVDKPYITILTRGNHEIEVGVYPSNFPVKVGDRYIYDTGEQGGKYYLVSNGSLYEESNGNYRGLWTRPKIGELWATPTVSRPKAVLLESPYVCQPADTFVRTDDVVAFLQDPSAVITYLQNPTCPWYDNACS